ncbi:MAG TPA: IclR family transcriptional regulator [Anaerolineae bacterium]
MTTDLSAVRTVNRISDILNCFSSGEPVLGLTAISNRLGLPRSTAHRLLTALESQGFLTRAPYGHGYQLGYHLLRWGLLAQATLDLRNEALPVLRRLAEVTGETAIVSVLDGEEGLCVDIVDSPHPVRLAMQAGQRLHLHAGASAKVLWAFLSEAEIRRLLEHLDLVPLQPNTIVEPEALRRELAAIRSRGYATSFEETDQGAMGIAVPVYDHAGQPIAGIGIAAPLARIPPESVAAVVPRVLEAGRELSARIGASV